MSSCFFFRCVIFFCSFLIWIFSFLARKLWLIFVVLWKGFCFWNLRLGIWNLKLGIESLKLFFLKNGIHCPWSSLRVYFSFKVTKFWNWCHLFLKIFEFFFIHSSWFFPFLKEKRTKQNYIFFWELTQQLKW